MGLVVHEQAADGTLRIDRHLADGVDGEVVGGLVQANDGEDLDGLGDVAQYSPATGLVEHALEIGRECGRLPGDEQLAAAGERRDAGRDVDPRRAAAGGDEAPG